MHSRHHYQVKRNGEVLERGTVRGKVEKLSTGWQAVDATGTCDLVSYVTRTTAAMSLLVGCLYGIHDARCNCQ